MVRKGFVFSLEKPILTQRLFLKNAKILLEKENSFAEIKNCLHVLKQL